MEPRRSRLDLTARISGKIDRMARCVRASRSTSAWWSQMRILNAALGAAVVAMSVAACAARPTQVTTTWRDRSLAPIQFRKMMAIVPGEDPELRRRIEDRLASRLPNTTASYRVIPDAELADTQRVRAHLAEGGFDGVVVLRLTSIEQRVGPDTTRLSSEDLLQYLRRTPRSALRPGRETVITMESRLYSLRDEKLVWAATSESFNPLSLGELIGHLVDASVEELRKQRLI